MLNCSPGSPGEYSPGEPGQSLKRAVLGKGHSDPELRQHAYEKVSDQVLTGDNTPISAPALTSYIDKLSQHAYKSLGRDFEALQAEGYSKDEMVTQ